MFRQKNSLGKVPATGRGLFEELVGTEWSGKGLVKNDVREIM